MDNELCRLYSVTTLDGLKVICNNEPFAGNIDVRELTQIGDDSIDRQMTSEEFAHKYVNEMIFGFHTLSIDYSLACKIISVLKEFEYYEYAVIASDGLTVLDTGSSDADKKYLTMKTVVSVVDDNQNKAKRANRFLLDGFGVHNVLSELERGVLESTERLSQNPYWVEKMMDLINKR